MSLRIAIVVALVASTAIAAPRRFALLIGINDYTASRLTTIRAPAPERDWPNLSGAVNDADAMRELLVLLRGFDARDIVTLRDQAATRDAILAAMSCLGSTAAKDDVVFVYFAGHGSQVRNSRSDEPDKLDESIVPADSRRGAADIRDKELRRIFNAILDRGARLTVIIDACHSGSGARGLLTLAQPRGIKPDLRDVADGTEYGPRPENRGAIVISAAHDDEDARETRGDRGAMHGAFTWAWLRAMRDAMAGETVSETFARAAARLRAEMPFQNPVFAGDGRLPFLGSGVATRSERTAFAIERVHGSTAFVSGGWAHGITEGSELRPIGERTSPLIVTTLLGLGRCEARVPATAHVRSGMLLELSGWAAPPPRPLRIAIPRADIDVAAFARRIKYVKLIHDPTVRTPDFVLRRAGDGWELVDANRRVRTFASDDEAVKDVAHLDGTLFVQLPATPAIAAEIAGPAVIEVVERAEDADYVLVGRYARNRVEYAWLRPNARRSDRRSSSLPLRTTWTTDAPDAAAILRDRALRLHKIQAWMLLESPAEGRWPYRLGLRRDSDRQLVGDGARVTGGETYTLELSAATSLAHVGRRHVYVFTIDSWGQSTLLYPISGSVENHFPLAGVPPPAVISLPAKFAIAPPYGTDTYILLTTEEPLTNPAILEWDGVRSAMPNAASALERLLVLTSSIERGARVLTSSTWSIERIVIESVT